MAVLMIVNGNTPGQLVDLKDDETVIGRLPECSVVLDQQGVSRRHAAIRRMGKEFVVADLNSRNKTFLNEQPLPPEQNHPLKHGDRIVICDVELVFYVQSAAGQRPSGPEAQDDLIITETGEETTVHTMDASRSDVVSTIIRPEVKLRAILEISRNLASSLKLDAVAPKILDSLLDIFPQAERCFLVLLKPGDGKPTIRQTFHKHRPPKRAAPGVKPSLMRPSGDESRLSISRTIMNTVLNQRKAVLSQDAGNDANLPTSASIADLKIRSFMCAPILTPDQVPLGILQLDTTDRKQFVQDDLDLLVAVAGQASIAVQNAAMHESLLARERLDRDLRLAEQVQRRFIPQSTPKLDPFQFFAYYQATYSVGGDFYDFVSMPDGRLALIVGDVSGKGISAALMMAKFSGDARSSILIDREPALATNRLNQLLCDAGLDERFITACVGVLDPETRRFTFASAGHPPVLVRRASGGVQEFGRETTGFPLGIMPGTEYEPEVIELNPGDVVVLYSDGVTDATNASGQLYDTSENPRLKRRLAASSGGPEAIGRSILQDIREFVAGHAQADDITLVCFGPSAG